MGEILLPLEREYTPKEQIGLLEQQNANLVRQLEEGLAINKELKRKLHNFMEGKEVPPGGAKWITSKSHNKLIEKYQDLHKRFWEVIKEYDEYKKHVQLTVYSKIDKNDKGS